MKTNHLYTASIVCGLLLLCGGCLETVQDNWVDPNPGKEEKLDNAPPPQPGTEAITEAEFQELVPQEPVTDAGSVSLSDTQELTTQEITEQDYPPKDETK